MWERIGEVVGAFVRPVPKATIENLQRIWNALPEKYRSHRQMWGNAFEGCGATIGAMPRCDFQCRGCYLGDEANRIPAEPVEAIKEQMRILRSRVGRSGNLQLTDGEVILRPVEEVIELLQYANEIELIPMLMTHGDSFRRRPGLLERLVVEGGLREVSIHVDTTQRGRMGSEYKYAESEAELNPLRQEFADMIADVRARTGERIRAATTMTVTGDNLSGVPDVVAWLRDEGSKSFSLISFQPAAQVGRTDEGLGGNASVEALWRGIAHGMLGDEMKVGALNRGNLWHGHPDCSRWVNGMVVIDREDDTRDFVPMFDDDDSTKRKWLQRLVRIPGFISPWAEARGGDQALWWSRLAGLALRNPIFVFWHTPPWVLHQLRQMGGVRGMLRWLRNKREIRQFLLVSHHFMSAEEIATPTGQERLDMCVFHVPVNGEIHSMCAVNALGIRDLYYEQISDGLPVVPNKRDKTAA